jgi:hypothetical protein
MYLELNQEELSSAQVVVSISVASSVIWPYMVRI